MQHIRCSFYIFSCCIFSSSTHCYSWFKCFVIVVVVVVAADSISRVCISERTHMLHVCDSFGKHADSSKHGVFLHVLKPCQSQWLFNHQLEIDLDFNSYLVSLYKKDPYNIINYPHAGNLLCCSLMFDFWIQLVHPVYSHQSLISIFNSLKSPATT